MKKLFSGLLVAVLLMGLGGCGQTLPEKSRQKAQITFVNEDHIMEHVTFAGGYLRSEPELVPGNIVEPLIKGSRGIIYGKRRINKLEWAKVTTREGATGWYTPADGGAKGTGHYLNLNKSNYQKSYPRISGIEAQAAAKINQEISAYLEAFTMVVGPVGDNLQCRVTCNRNNILSILFTLPKINYRTYDIELTQDREKWSQLNRYCAISPLQNLAASVGLTAEVSDLQYAMTFDLTTGQRLKLDYFLGSKRKDVTGLLRQLGDKATLQEDNFYVEGSNTIVGMAESNKPGWGRTRLDLSSLETRKF